MNLESQANETGKQFASLYGRPARWIAAAPGRVNIIGEHTDYNDGFVLPMAIERYTVIAAAPAQAAGRPRIKVSSTDMKGEVEISLDPLQKGEKGHWTNYIRGVVAGFQALGGGIGSLDILINSTVPLGGGLSSSAALEVSMATLLEAVTGRKLDPVEQALLCQTAEHKFADMPCGIMDQFISVMGRENHLLLLDCRSRET